MISKRISILYRSLLCASVLLILIGTARAEKFLVGCEIPLSGAFSKAGTDVQRGITVAVDLFNRHHADHQVELITIDDESSPAKAVSAVEKLAASEVLAITGGYGTNLVAPASDAAERNNLVYITATGLGTSLSARGYKNFFRTSNIEAYARGVLGLVQSLDIKSVSIIYSTREPPTDLVKIVEPALKVRGLKVDLNVFDPGLTDFKPLINTIKLRDKPDAILMFAYENDYVNILRAVRLLKPEVKAVIASWSLLTAQMVAEFPTLLPNVYGNVNSSIPPVYKSDDEREFTETFKAKYKTDPSFQSQIGYVQAQVLFDAILRAHAKGVLKKLGGLADELRKTNINTLQGDVLFDDRGDNTASITGMGQVQDGKIMLVWPSERADGKSAFPGVSW
jgi:branched-chain amino acid transport system substrate-binding protein